jgi:hypothetical protein
MWQYLISHLSTLCTWTPFLSASPGMLLDFRRFRAESITNFSSAQVGLPLPFRPLLQITFDGEVC